MPDKEYSDPFLEDLLKENFGDIGSEQRGIPDNREGDAPSAGVLSQEEEINLGLEVPARPSKRKPKPKKSQAKKFLKTLVKRKRAPKS